MEDQAIISLLFARAENAIAALEKRFESQLYKTAMNILDNPQDAQECVNDTYLALWNAIPPAEPDPLAAYVQRTGRNIALKRHRQNTAQKRNTLYDISLDELAECLPGDDLVQQLDTREVGRAINSFLTAQPRDSRIIFLRRYWYGDSVKDIALTMHMQESAAAVRLSRLRKKLKEHLIKEGFLL